jgi:hypothetical protein
MAVVVKLLVALRRMLTRTAGFSKGEGAIANSRASVFTFTYLDSTSMCLLHHLQQIPLNYYQIWPRCCSSARNGYYFS